MPSGDDILQSEIDRIVSHHTKKLRMEFEDIQKQTARSLMAAIGEALMKNLREKDEEIQRMGKLNLALQERVNSLYVENQLWREMAQTSGPVTEDEIRAVLLQKNPVTTQDLVNQFKSRLNSREDKNTFAAILRRISKIEKTNTASYVVLRERDNQ